MAIRSRKPTSAGRRFQTTSDFSEITKSSPERTLTAPLSKSGGRNSYGRKTARHKGGGNKNQYRIIDFKRDKKNIPATVSTVEYDPNRSARIALIEYPKDAKYDNAKSYILAPVGMKAGDKVTVTYRMFATKIEKK